MELAPCVIVIVTFGLPNLILIKLIMHWNVYIIIPDVYRIYSYVNNTYSLNIYGTNKYEM